jgi:hypothetical protein
MIRIHDKRASLLVPDQRRKCSQPM